MATSSSTSANSDNAADRNSDSVDGVPLPDETTERIPHSTTIIVAGCFGMAYSQLTLSPAGIEFVRHLGGSGLHVGILGAIPTGMLFLQFVSAVVANHLT